MCGISGFLGIDGEMADAAVHRMMRTMPHRGPDDEGYVEYRVGDRAIVAFGFRRLSILDLTPAGHQPMVDRVSGNALVFNGEIYNYISLRSRLKSEGVRFESSGDTEVLLLALSVWGEAALSMLDGMYAIAFYEARTQRVLLARDHLGIKPLYTSSQRGKLLFSSEVRSLFASGLVATDFDPAGVASYLAFGSPQDPLTVHREVRSFPAGCCQWIRFDDQGHPADITPPRRYWSRPMPRPESAYAKRDYERDIRSLFLETVREQCQADVPLGVLLSAGLDSTLIATAVKTLGMELNTFSAGVHGDRQDSELAIARRTAARLGARHQELALGEENVPAFWEGWLAAADRPSVDGFNTYLVCKAIQGSCVKVALSGLGADEIFGGYGSFVRAARFSRLLRPIGLLPDAVRRAVGRLAVAGTGARWKRHAWRLELFSGVASSPVSIAIALKRLLGTSELSRLGFEADPLGLTGEYLPPQARDGIVTSEVDAFQAVSQVETSLYMNNTLLRDADVNSMARSIELRVPFLGKRFVEAGCRVPTSAHISPEGVGKQVLRQSMADLVPAEVLERPKTGFALPLGDWMFSVLRDSCEASIDGLDAIPFLDHSAARLMWQSFTARPSDSHWLRPMLLVTLGNYADSVARTYIDAAGAIKLRPRDRKSSGPGPVAGSAPAARTAAGLDSTDITPP